MSYAAREILIKVVAQAIPTYVMSCFKLPDNLCDSIESMIGKFWCGSKNGEKKIHWLSWDSMCREKKDGGMGFKVSRNLILQCWQNKDGVLCKRRRVFSLSLFG